MRDLSQHIMDIIQNSIAAKASKITANIFTSQNDEELMIEISDNGTGMDVKTLEAVIDPFTTSRKTRKVGLGIPLFKTSAERSGGTFKITSSKGKGTTVLGTFNISHIDRPPLGAIGETMSALIAAYPDIEFELIFESSRGEFLLNSLSIVEKLEGVPINNIEVLEWIKEYIDEGKSKVFGGVLNEIIG